MSPVDGLPGTPVYTPQVEQDLRSRFTNCATALAKLDVAIGISTSEMSRLARQDPVSERICDIARKGQEKLGKLKELEAAIAQIAEEFQVMPHPRIQTDPAANHARLGADLSEALMKARRLPEVHTADLRRLLTARLPNFAAALSKHAARFSSVVGVAFAVFGMVYSVLYYWVFDIQVLNYVNSLGDFVLMGIAHATIAIVMVAITAGFFWWRAERVRRAAAAAETSLDELAALVREVDRRRRKPLRVLPQMAAVVLLALLIIIGGNAAFLYLPGGLSTVYTRSGSVQHDVKLLGTVANYAFLLRFERDSEHGLVLSSGTPVVLRAEELRCVVPVSDGVKLLEAADSCDLNGPRPTSGERVVVRVEGDSPTSWRHFARDTMACDPVDEIDWDRRTSEKMIVSTPLFVDGRWNALDRRANLRHTGATAGCGEDWKFECMREELRTRLDDMLSAGAGVESIGIAGFASPTGLPEENLLLSLYRAEATACLVADQVDDGERGMCTDVAFVTRLIGRGNQGGALTYTSHEGAKPIALHLHAMGEGRQPPDYIGKDGDASDRRVLAIACRSRTGATQPRPVTASNYSSAPPASQEILDVQR
jgi:hypothetical protein